MTDSGKGIDTLVKMIPGMGCGHLGTDARLISRHDWKEKAHHIYTFFQHTLGKALGQRRLADHDRNYRVASTGQFKTQCLELLTEISGVAPQPVAQLVRGGEVARDARLRTTQCGLGVGLGLGFGLGFEFRLG